MPVPDFRRFALSYRDLAVAPPKESRFISQVNNFTFKYSDDQPRDESGRWTAGDGSAAGGFDSVEAETAWGNATFGNILLTEDQTSALQEYRGGQFGPINRTLRTGEPPVAADTTNGRIDALDAVMEKATLDREVTVYHGAGRVTPDVLANLSQVGTKISDAGFQSTSFDIGTASKFALEDHPGFLPTVFAIAAPSGTHAFYMNVLSGNYARRERELLLARGLTMQVTGATVENNLNVISMRVLPGDHTGHPFKSAHQAFKDGEIEDDRFVVDVDQLTITPPEDGAKYSDSQPRDDSGRWSDTGAGGSSRESRATASYVPMTKERRAIATSSEKEVAKIIGGTASDDNKPFDVIKGKFAVECKTIISGKNPKVTLHPESLARKEKEAKANGWKASVIAIDARGDKPVYYWKEGLGSFRLSSMTKVTSAELKTKYK